MIKSRLQDYFDGTGFDRWSAIYGEGDVSRIRETVREGHAQMLHQAEEWLLETCHGGTLLDAGCGTGLFSLMMARRGFEVTGVDIAPRMIEAARAAANRESVSIDYEAGDLEQVTGPFDAVACFDVLVHYPREPFVQMLSHLASITRGPLIITYAPYNRLLAAMHWVGGLFPKGQRRTEIQMTPDHVVAETLAAAGMRVKRSAHVGHGFYHVKLLEAEQQ